MEFGMPALSRTRHLALYYGFYLTSAMHSVLVNMHMLSIFPKEHIPKRAYTQSFVNIFPGIIGIDSPYAEQCLLFSVY